MPNECREALKPLREKLHRMAQGHDGYIYGVIADEITAALDTPCELENRVAEWISTRIGEASLHRRERAMRLLEEAVELSQAEGITQEIVGRQVAHVFARPAGDPAQEAAGVAVTLLGWCAATGNRLLDLARDEIERIEAKTIEQIRGSLARKADDDLVYAPSETPILATGTNECACRKALEVFGAFIARTGYGSLEMRDQLAATLAATCECDPSGKLATLAELESSFELRWRADMRAIKRWQAANPGNDLVWPDHADLCVWLMDQLAEEKRQHKLWRVAAEQGEAIYTQLRAELEQVKGNGQGTPPGRLKAIGRYAEERCGYNPTSGKPAEVALIEALEQGRLDLTEALECVQLLAGYPGPDAILAKHQHAALGTREASPQSEGQSPQDTPEDL